VQGSDLKGPVLGDGVRGLNSDSVLPVVSPLQPTGRAWAGCWGTMATWRSSSSGSWTSWAPNSSARDSERRRRRVSRTLHSNIHVIITQWTICHMEKYIFIRDLCFFVQSDFLFISFSWYAYEQEKMCTLHVDTREYNHTR